MDARRKVESLRSERQPQKVLAELLPFLDALAELIANQILRDSKSRDQGGPVGAVRDIAEPKGTPALAADGGSGRTALTECVGVQAIGGAIR